MTVKEKATLNKLVDELGDLEVELKPLGPKLRRAEQLRSQIRERYDTKSEQESFIAEGDRFVINIGPRKLQKHINIAKLYKSVTLSRFLKLVSVTLKALEEHCEEWVFDSVVTEKQTGYRPLEITQRGEQPT